LVAKSRLNQWSTVFGAEDNVVEEVGEGAGHVNSRLMSPLRGLGLS
jgi:hypothetical protein